MKMSLILKVTIGIAFFLPWIIYDNVKPYYPSIQEFLNVCSADDKYNDSSVTEGKHAKSLVEGQPDIFCEEPIYNFGKRYKYENIKHVFVFQNRGTKELKIEKIESSCGCIIGETTVTNVDPCMSGTIVVNYRTGPDTGTMTKSIRVYSNDPDAPVYTLQLSGEIIEDITIHPRQIKFGYVSLGEKAHAEIEVQPRPGFNLEVKDVLSSNPIVSAKHKKDKQKNKYVVEATLKDNTMVGVWTGNLYIHTNSERQRQVIVPFSGEVLGDVQLYPHRLYFGSINRTSECGKSVFITLLKKNIRINKIEVQPGFLVSELLAEPHNDDVKGNATLRVFIKIKKDAPAGKINGILKIYTNSEIQPIIDVPVSGEIVEG